MVNWKEENPFSRITSPFKEFTEELTQEWINYGFNKKETRGWLESGLQPTDASFAQWLNVVKSKNSEQVADMDHDELQKLKEEWKEFLEEIKDGSRLSVGVIKQIKSFENFFDDEVPNSWNSMAKEQKSLIEKLISDWELKERCSNYGLCRICYQPNIDRHILLSSRENGNAPPYNYYFCQFCNDEAYFKKKTKRPTSGNQVIDDFIHEWQSKVKKKEVLEWIPYEQFTDIEYLAKGGFGKVYKACWTTRPILAWGNTGDFIKKDKRWGWGKYNRWVVLKILDNSQDISRESLHEIACHKLVDNNRWIVKCYGISQDLKTKNYIIVMEYIMHGDLRQYLKNYSSSEGLLRSVIFKGKVSQLQNIINGLNSIHKKGLIHRDLHAGNILNRHVTCFITDLGLCRPANETNQEKIYGVMPYVAPEVLQQKGYTPASDIYSFGILAYEIINCLPPYTIYDEKEEIYKEIPYSNDLFQEICWGKRPQFQMKVPQLLEDLIKRCWDAEPEKRPTIDEILSNLLKWCEGDENSEFDRQAKEAQKLNRSIPYHQPYPQSIRHTSRLLDFKNPPQLQISYDSRGSVDKGLDINEFDLNELNFSEKDATENISSNWERLCCTSPSFTPELIQAWTNYRFTLQQTQDWININPPSQQEQARQEPAFYAWLRDTKKLTPEQVLNHHNLNSLKQEYQSQQQAYIQQANFPPK